MILDVIYAILNNDKLYPDFFDRLCHCFGYSRICDDDIYPIEITNLAEAFRPNFEESANMIVRREASIIFLFRLASAIFELVIPCSKSIPSTPKKSLEQVICSKSCEV